MPAPSLTASGLASTVSPGAYGFRVAGLRDPALVDPAPGEWPLVHVERRAPGPAAPATTRLEDGEVAFGSGWSLRFERESRTATYFLPQPVSDGELVHPRLAPLARFFAHWLGYESLHGGAFVAGGGAWAVLAARGGGKSTTLARLAASGVPVLADDVLVIDGENALAGPRCIDLRAGEGLPEVRGGTRRRLALSRVEPSFPLLGCFVLEWAPAVELRALRPRERLVGLAAHGSRPAALLDLARLPAWRVGRPLDLAVLDDVCGKLLEAAAG